MMRTVNARDLWSQILVGAGGVAMVAGAVDPLEGAVVILAGSGLVTLGTWLADLVRRLIKRVRPRHAA